MIITTDTFRLRGIVDFSCFRLGGTTLLFEMNFIIFALISARSSCLFAVFFVSREQPFRAFVEHSHVIFVAPRLLVF